MLLKATLQIKTSGYSRLVKKPLTIEFLTLQESFPTVWHMKNMLESFKKDHQVKESLKIKNLVLSTELNYGLCLVYACIQKDRTRLLVGTK